MPFFAYLAEIFKQTLFYNYFVFLAIVAVGIALIVSLLHFTNKNPYRVSLLLLLGGALAVSVTFFVNTKENTVANIVFMLGMGIAVVAFVSLVFYAICTRVFFFRLEKIRNKNYIKSIRLIQRFRLKKLLTARQQNKYYTHYIFILVKLGSIEAAEKILQNLKEEKKKPLRNHAEIALLVSEMKAFESGNVDDFC